MSLITKIFLNVISYFSVILSSKLMQFGICNILKFDKLQLKKIKSKFKKPIDLNEIMTEAETL